MPKNAKGRLGCSNTRQAANDNHITPDEYNDRDAAMQSRVSHWFVRRGIPNNLAHFYAGIYCNEACRHD